jgi:hypothetical protein
MSAKGASMFKRGTTITAIVLGTMLAAGAVPALSADNGTIVGTISVPAVTPCIQISTTSLDFGSASFAAQGADSRAESAGVGVTNCSTVESGITMTGSDATNAGSTWSLTDDWLNCDGRLNRYGLFQFELPERFSGQYLITTPRTLVHRRPPTNDPVQTFAAGESETLGFQVAMPCVGSNGAGQTFTFNIGLTATVV